MYALYVHDIGMCVYVCVHVCFVCMLRSVCNVCNVCNAIYLFIYVTVALYVCMCEDVIKYRTAKQNNGMYGNVVHKFYVCV